MQGCDSVNVPGASPAKPLVATQGLTRLNCVPSTFIKCGMRPRFDVFMKLDNNRVRYVGTADTLEEAEALAMQKSSCENPCIVIHSAFGVSSGVALFQAEKVNSNSLAAV